MQSSCKTCTHFWIRTFLTKSSNQIKKILGWRKLGIADRTSAVDAEESRRCFYSLDTGFSCAGRSVAGGDFTFASVDDIDILGSVSVLFRYFLHGLRAPATCRTFTLNLRIHRFRGNLYWISILLYLERLLYCFDTSTQCDALRQLVALSYVTSAHIVSVTP